MKDRGGLFGGHTLGIRFYDGNKHDNHRLDLSSVL